MADKTLSQLRDEAALERWAFENARRWDVATLVVPPYERNQRTTGEPINIFGNSWVVPVSSTHAVDEGTVLYAPVYDGTVSKYWYETQAEAVLHLLARPHQPSDQETSIAVRFAVKVLNLPDL